MCVPSPVCFQTPWETASQCCERAKSSNWVTSGGQPCSGLSKGGCRWGGNSRAVGCSERSYEFMSCARCRVFSLGPCCGVFHFPCRTPEYLPPSLRGKKTAWPQSGWIRSFTAEQTFRMLSPHVASKAVVPFHSATNKQLHEFGILFSADFFSGMQ